MRNGGRIAVFSIESSAMALPRVTTAYILWPLRKALLCALPAVILNGDANAQQPEDPTNGAPVPAEQIEPVIMDDLPGELVPGDVAELEEVGPVREETITRLEAQLLLRDLVEAQDYEEAIPVGERVVALTEEEFGEESPEAATALANLGEVQRRAGRYEESERNFLNAVALFRQIEGEFTESVINPLVGLGAVFHARGEYLQAVTAFEEARTVNRRVFGLLNEEQIVLMDHIANTLVSMQRYGEADEQQMDALRIMERVHGSDTLEILPAIYNYAEWLRDGYRFNEERDLYTRAMSIIRDQDGKESPLLAKPLREVGNSFRAQKFPEGRGISSLKRALEVLEAQPAPDPLATAEALRDIGDWNVAFSKVGPTGDEYRRAWQLLGEVEGGEELRTKWFSEPDYVLRENPSSRGLQDPSEPGALPGHVLIVFDVDEHGRTEEVAVVESVPPGFKDDSTARAIGRSRFRPRMVDGEIVRAEGLARSFTFHYLPEE
jgi:tetratricopeptide (TPR) repeat protein